MPKVKITVVESRCRGGYFTKGQETEILSERYCCV